LPVFAAMSLVPEDDPLTLVAAIAALSGLLMGATVAAITGMALVWLLRAQTPCLEQNAMPLRAPNSPR